MINVDINFLRQIAIVIRMMLEVVNGRYNNDPAERQRKINTAAQVKRQLDYIIREASEEDALNYIRKGFVKEATF